MNYINIIIYIPGDLLHQQDEEGEMMREGKQLEAQREPWQYRRGMRKGNG